MKIGQNVTLYWPDEKARLKATVVAINDKTGKSNAKILDVQYKEKSDGEQMVAKGVHHMADAVEGEPFWALSDEKVGKDWADVEVTDETPAPEVEPVEKKKTGKKR